MPKKHRVTWKVGSPESFTEHSVVFACRALARKFKINLIVENFKGLLEVPLLEEGIELPSNGHGYWHDIDGNQYNEE